MTIQSTVRPDGTYDHSKVQLFRNIHGTRAQYLAGSTWTDSVRESRDWGSATPYRIHPDDESLAQTVPAVPAVPADPYADLRKAQDEGAVIECRKVGGPWERPAGNHAHFDCPFFEYRVQPNETLAAFAGAESLNEQFAILVGNPVDGVIVLGPFESDDAAREHGEGITDHSWWVTTITKPEQP